MRDLCYQAAGCPEVLSGKYLHNLIMTLISTVMLLTESCLQRRAWTSASAAG